MLIKKQCINNTYVYYMYHINVYIDAYIYIHSMRNKITIMKTQTNQILNTKNS